MEEKRKTEKAEKLALSLMQPISKEEKKIVSNAIYSIGPPNEVLAQVGQDSVKRASMQQLKPGQWLNDEVIHYFLNMLAIRDKEMCKNNPSCKRSHFFKSFFMTKLLDKGNANLEVKGKYNYKNVKRWSKKVPGQDLFNLDKIIFPINHDQNHWICAVAFMTEKCIQMYNLMGMKGMHYLEHIFQYIKDEYQDKKGGLLPDQDQWSLVSCMHNMPQQNNGA